MEGFHHSAVAVYLVFRAYLVAVVAILARHHTGQVATGEVNNMLIQCSG